MSSSSLRYISLLTGGHSGLRRPQPGSSHRSLSSMPSAPLSPQPLREGLTGHGWSADGRPPRRQAHASSPRGGQLAQVPESAGSTGQRPTGPAKTRHLGSDGSSMTACRPLATARAQNQWPHSVATRGDLLYLCKIPRVAVWLSPSGF